VKKRIVRVGKIAFGGNSPFVLIAGPCVLEDRQSALRIARDLTQMTGRIGLPFVFKASYDKANRTSVNAYRGPGLIEGLKILSEIKERFGIPILSDVHQEKEIEKAAEVLDILQIPAFLCRQTDLILETASAGKTVNIKKGQFLAPWDIESVVKKIESTGNRRILLTERGVSFGYNNLVTDFTSLEIMSRTGYPVVYDVTHSLQQPGGLGNATGGRSEFIPLLARCGVAAGTDAIFMECHLNPGKALSDGHNMISLSRMEPLLRQMMEIDQIVKTKRNK
jgi:2-dehydro-3-deoxyphosphooctonate aldolase (KDO 8-P synthase)